MANNGEIEARVKNSFTKVKEDIESLKKEFFHFKEEVMTKISELLTKKEDKDVFFNSSGNEGASDDRRRPTTTYDRPPSDHQLQSEIDKLMHELEDTILKLSDREFSVFKAVYELEKELGDVTYNDVSKQLNIKKSWVKELVNLLLIKKVPINKVRYLHSKVSLSIKKEFRGLNIYEKLIKIRSNPDQKTLFDV